MGKAEVEYQDVSKLIEKELFFFPSQIDDVVFPTLDDAYKNIPDSKSKKGKK